MKPLEYYRGREQTYLKHFFLERYLERVAYNIGSFATDFVYVDGFSGPWQSADEALEDTSFIIAIRKLREVREGLSKVNRHPRMRCLFVEKDAEAFSRLEKAISVVQDIEVCALHNEFEQAIHEVLRFIGRGFSLVFIDPTGWTGFGLRRITPILQHQPGEVLVNFMMNHINWLLEDPRPQIAATFEELSGGPGWEPVLQAGAHREEAILDLYRQRMRVAGDFAHVTSTRILMPTADRTYFHLVYGTRHVKGLVEFRNVEQKFVAQQEQVRHAAKQDRRVERTGQGELFAAAMTATGGPPAFQDERANNQRAARDRLDSLVRERRQVPYYPDVLASLLELPLVWEADVKRIVMEARDAGELEVRGLGPRERTPKEGHILVREDG